MRRSARPNSGGALLKADAWLTAVLESISDAILGATVEGDICSANAAACRLFGYSPAEFLELKISDISVPDRSATVAKVLDRLRAGESVERYQAPLIRKSGERFPASLTVSAVADHDGKIVGYSAIVRDVSAEKQSQENRRVLKALVSSSPDAIYSRTVKGRITSWNPSAQKLFGYSEHQIVGRSILEIVPPEGESELGDFTRLIVQGELVEDYETIRLTKEGQRIPVALTLFPIRDDTGAVTGIGCIARDLLRTGAMRTTFAKLGRLSPREREVLGLLSDGVNNKEIANALGLSEQTVKNYVSRILLKLGTGTRTQAAAEFLSFRAFMSPAESQD